MQENREMIQENKMGVMPVGKLIFNISLPIMISMLVQAMYNIVDSFFVAKLSENALTAVSLAFPMQSLLIAVAVGTGVGVNALLSKSLGEKDYKKADETASNGAFVFLLSYVIFLILGFTIVRPFYAGQVKTADPEILELGVDYLSVVMVVSFGMMGQILFERLLTSTGKTVYSMISQLSGAVTNIILDPILIFGLLGAPKLGVAGAAWATVIGQCIGALVGFFCNLKFNHEVHLNFRGFRPNLSIIGTIYQVGIPSICMQSIGSVMTYAMNLILIGFTSTATAVFGVYFNTSTATAVFGVYFKLQSFFFMPVFGLTNGITPIIAYSYGARQRKRMVKTIRISMVVAAILLTLGCAVFVLMPEALLKIFDASEAMCDIGNPALRTIALSFLFAWFSIVASTVFQALGKATFSLVISVMRQLVILIPVAFVLSKIGGLHTVWWGRE